MSIYQTTQNHTLLFSTLRQLGFVIMTMYIALSSLAFFHLLTHAIFKALLLMCTGGVVHSVGDSKDIRLMGSSSICIPFTSCLMVSSFSLYWMLFLVEFYSRDFIWEIFSMRHVNVFGT